jgi:hypothetical protein
VVLIPYINLGNVSHNAPLKFSFYFCKISNVLMFVLFSFFGWDWGHVHAKNKSLGSFQLLPEYVHIFVHESSLAHLCGLVDFQEHISDL